MKYVCGLLGILFIFVGNYLPLPDPGLGMALFVCGSSLCLSALAAEIHPLLEMMVDDNDFPHHSHLIPEPKAAPAPTPEA